MIEEALRESGGNKQKGGSDARPEPPGIDQKLGAAKCHRPIAGVRINRDYLAYLKLTR